ncbi:Tetratricopeptide repeat [Plasmodiophora brassicae]|uniref:Uncharacterized protein n=1 Tax=Plasmodiophora brassicae TaxID=37360 RepID=A0A3P3Y6S6_PLABS|nr:unnamed protein product [Plasmodiophora brassicae]
MVADAVSHVGALMRAVVTATGTPLVQIRSLCCHISRGLASSLTRDEVRQMVHFVISKCDHILGTWYLEKDSGSATVEFLEAQFDVARVLLCSLHDACAAVDFLTHMSVSWPLCRASPAAQLGTIVDVVRDFDVDRSGRISSACSGGKFPVQSRLLRLYAACLVNCDDEIPLCSAVLSLCWALQSPCNARESSRNVFAAVSGTILRPKDESSVDDGTQAAVATLANVIDDNSNDSAFLRGYCLFASGEFDDAVAHFTSAGRRTRPFAYFFIGCCHGQNSTIIDAQAFFHRAIQHPQVEPYAAFNIAVLLERSKEFPAACQIYEALLQDASTISISRDTLIERACRCYEMTADIVAGSTLFSRHANVVESVDVARSYVHFLLRCVDDPASALDRAQRLLDRFPSDVPLLEYRSQAHFALSHYEDCIAGLDRILELCSASHTSTDPPLKRAKSADLATPPEHVSVKVNAYINKSLALLCLRRKQEAVSVLQWAVFHDPDSVPAQFNLCALLIIIGKIEQACARWLQFKGIDLDLDPGDYDRLMQPDVAPAPIARHVAGSVTDAQQSALTNIAIQHWLHIRADHVFMKRVRIALRQ